jgi:hypothetical protein
MNWPDKFQIWPSTSTLALSIGTLQRNEAQITDNEVYSLPFSKIFLLDCRIVPRVWYIVVFHFIVINPSLFYLIKYWFVVFPPFLSDQLYVAYGYVVVLQIVLSPVLEHNDKQICGTIIIVFIRKQHILSSNYVMQMLILKINHFPKYI